MRTRNDSALTHTGNVRNNNEDAFVADPAHGLWVVADGMGGHEAGEVASAIVIKTITDCIARGQDLASAIQAAHHNILDSSRKGKGARGMGSTVIAVHSTESHYQIGWVGDSRAYLWTPDGQHSGTLEQLSTDHSYVQMLVRAGAITPEEANHHPDKNVITQCLGSVDLANVRVDTIDREWQDNQWLLLCSDGLTDELQDSQISAILANSNNTEEATSTLVREALQAGGRDNTTVIVLGKPAANRSFWKKILGRN
ncbi:MAG TPA: protein phosphatase 2C domain-containing protein [Pseudomonadales bacterium]|nr:protein phosphatase 2C domain-containing protein [Pseudomonadales bacterium]